MNFDQGRLRVPGLVAPLAIVAAVALLAAGCGKKEEPSTDGPVVPITTTTTTDRQGGERRGGGDGAAKQDGRPVSQEKAVQEAIELFLTSPNADRVCRELLTPAFLRRAYGNVAGCKAARRPASLAVSAQISGLKVRGSTAEAKAKPNGGVNNNERLTFGLQRSGTDWLITAVRSNARVGP